MTDIKTKLSKWASNNNGSVELLSSISIKTPTLQLNVSGDSLEDAYKKLESLIKEPEVSKSEEAPSKEEAPFSASKALESAINNSNESSAEAKTNSLSVINNTVTPNPTDLTAILGGRNLVRIYDPRQPLGVGEQIIDYSGSKFVVK